MKTSTITSALTAERVVEQRKKKCLERANEVFEDGGAEIWMHSSIRSLGRRTPLSLLATEDGYQLVMDTLGRIEGGVIS